jgi:hypothetical protein
MAARGGERPTSNAWVGGHGLDSRLLQLSQQVSLVRGDGWRWTIALAIDGPGIAQARQLRRVKQEVASLAHISEVCGEFWFQVANGHEGTLPVPQPAGAPRIGREA